MAIKEVSGHGLNVGDHVKMNIKVLGEGDLDGVEFTQSGENYWRYMNAHPDEIYTVLSLDLDSDPNGVCIYELSGAMAGNTWAADELILIPEPTSHFEEIKNMTLEEMAEQLPAMLASLFTSGNPTSEELLHFLKEKPEARYE